MSNDLFREGDLVKYRWPSFLGPMHEEFDKGVGLVTKVEAWHDKGAPDRNFGVSVTVLWSNGNVEVYEEDELEYAS